MYQSTAYLIKYVVEKQSKKRKTCVSSDLKAGLSRYYTVMYIHSPDGILTKMSGIYLSGFNMDLLSS